MMMMMIYNKYDENRDTERLISRTAVAIRGVHIV